MPVTEIQPQYLLRLTSHEYRLVTLALAGKLTPADSDSVHLLGLKLANQRVSALTEMVKAAQKAASHAEELANPGGILGTPEESHGS